MGQTLRGHLILDVSLLPTLSSGFLGVLALFARTLPPGRRVVLLGPNPTVRALLMMTRFDEVMPIADTMDQARVLLS